MGSKKNSSKSSTTNQMTDNRQVVDGQNNIALSAGAKIDESVNVTDARRTVDNSRTTASITNADSAQIVALTTGLQRDMAQQQTDGMKAVAAIAGNIGGAATNVWQTTAANSAQAWGHTIDASEAALDKAFAASAGLTQAAAQIASTAMTTYQPVDGRAQETGMKLGVIAAGVAAAVLLMRNNKG